VPDGQTAGVRLRGPVPLLLASEFSAGLARASLATALGWQAYARAHDPLVLGLLGLAEFVPALLLALPAGHFADRHDRRLLAVVASIGSTVVAGLLALDAASGDTAVWPLYLLALCGGVAQAFLGPAFNPLLAASVPPAGLARVISLSSITWQTSSIVGPALAGVLQTVSDPAPYLAAMAAAAASTVFVAVLPAAIGTAHVVTERVTATWRDVTAGIRFVRATPALLGAISLDLAAVLFGGATALLPVFATDVLHVGAAGNGLLRAAPGVGAILVGVALTAWPLRRRVGIILFGAVATFGAATMVFGLSTSFPLSLAALAVVAGADMVSVLIRGTLAPLLTPPELRGRVSALESVFIRASNELGAFESGVAAALLGAVPAVVIGGAASVVVAGLWSVWFPSIRKVDRFEDLPVPDATTVLGATAE
jgi:MFS family permease